MFKTFGQHEYTTHETNNKDKAVFSHLKVTLCAFGDMKMLEIIRLNN